MRRSLLLGKYLFVKHTDFAVGARAVFGGGGVLSFRSRGGA